MRLYFKCIGRASDDDISKNEVKNTVVVSASFTFVCIAYLALQNLQSSLNQKANLGVLSLACMYAFFIVSATLAPTFIKIVGCKLSLVIAWIGQALYTIGNFYPHFGTLIPASVLLGLVSGPLWTSQSIYVSTNAYSLAKRKNKDLHSVLSKLNGIFFTMFQTAQIFGNLISSLVLDSGSYKGDTTNITRICGGGECPITLNSTKIMEPNKSTVYLLLGIFLGCDLIGLLLTTLFLPPLPKSDWSKQRSVRKSVVSCFAALSDTKLLSLVPLMAFEAIQQTILYSDFTKSYISCPVGIGMVGYIMAAFGGSTTLFSFIISRTAKFTGRYILFASGTVVNMAIFVCLYLWQPTPEELPYLFAIAGAWGFVDSVWRTQCNALIALLFPEKKEPAFANYHSWKSGMFAVSFLMCNFVCVTIKLLIAMALLAIAILLYISVEIRVYREGKNTFDISADKNTEITVNPPAEKHNECIYSVDSVMTKFSGNGNDIPQDANGNIGSNSTRAELGNTVNGVDQLKESGNIEKRNCSSNISKTHSLVYSITK